MNVKILILVLVLGVAGYFGYDYFSKQKESSGEKTENSSSEQEGDFVLSASFMCADGKTRFVAEFPTADSVVISRDGVTVRTLPRVEGAGQRFEDSEYVYVFAGEEVEVTTKASASSVVCSQPSDPNLAPVNFGDKGEGGGVKQDTALIVSESIVGKWKSKEDPKFVREFKDGGMVVDWYDNEIVSEGTFTVFTKEKPLPVSFPLAEGTVYLQLTMSGSQATKLNFKLVKLTPEALDLVYMDRGGALSFTRVE